MLDQQKNLDWHKSLSAITSFPISEGTRDRQQISHLNTVLVRHKTSDAQGMLDKKTGIGEDRDHQEPHLPCQKLL